MAFGIGKFGEKLAAFAAALLVATTAQAQIIQLGGSEAEIKAMLANQGYDRMDIVERGLSGATWQACKGPDRVQFKVYWDGRISQAQKIGGCRVEIGPEEVRQLLASRGYDRISVEDRGGSYLAVACIRNDRVRVEVNRVGDIGAERLLGPCENERSPADIQAILEAEGYDRIEFGNRQGRTFTVLACLEARRFELVVSRDGEVLDRKRAGECQRALTAAELPALLQSKGYERVAVTDPRLPRFKAEACRGRDRLELTVNRMGEVVDEVRIGRCAPPAALADITAVMRDEGYSQVKVVDNADKGFIATGCKADRREEFVFSRFAEILKQRDLGRCTSATVQEVLENLRAEGLEQTTVYVEACRGNRRVRITFDRLGQETARERIGPC